MSQNSLTSIWDGEVINLNNNNVNICSSQLPDDLINFFPDNGLDTIAKEAGIIEVEVSTQAQKVAQPPVKNKTIKIISLPHRNINIGNNQLICPNKLGILPNQIPQLIISPNNQFKQEAKIFRLITSPKNNLQPTWQIPNPQNRPFITTKLEENSNFTNDSLKRRKGSHSGKGLRHFSMKVCEKVQQKRVTSYNEVADELVKEFSEPYGSQLTNEQFFDQKNIRRRVYDALNVLMAMNIISKERKEIKWIGLPTNSAQETQKIKLEKQTLQERVQMKTQQLNDLILQQIAFKNLIETNRHSEQQIGPPPPNSAISLPFILLKTSKQTIIDCSISNDKSEFLFTFDKEFEIHDDIEVLKKMGLVHGLDKGHCNHSDLMRLSNMVPLNVQPHVHKMANSFNDVNIKIEQDICSSANNNQYDLGLSNSFQTEESMDEEITWCQDYSRQSSSCASRSEQQTPDYSDTNDC